MNPLSPDDLARLLDRYAPALALYARQWCDCPDDVVQEAFIKLASQATPPDNIAAWLYRVVRNGAIGHSRSARRRTQREAAVALRRDPWFESRPQDRLDGQAAAQALQGLLAEQREVVVARLWGDLPFAEIAALIGQPTSTVHRWYQQGLEALRERLGVPCPKK